MVSKKKLCLVITGIAICIVSITNYYFMTTKLHYLDNVPITMESRKQEKEKENPTTTTTTTLRITSMEKATTTTSQVISSGGNQNKKNYTTTSTSTTKILGFADNAYKEIAIKWYQRLELLGYSEHIVVAVDDQAAEYFRRFNNENNNIGDDTNHVNINNLRWEELPYKPCVRPQRDPRKYRRQLFGRRWRYIYDQLNLGYSILLTDVDNVFVKYISIRDELEQSSYDVFHAYSTSYPTYVFESMGFTVCGGMSWLRASKPVIRFVGSLVNTCKCLQNSKNDDDELCKHCMCDDQVVLNEMLWKGKHNITWDRTNLSTVSKPKSLSDYPWESITGISSKTKHRIKIWNRNFAYRGPMPTTCPKNNWVAMPLYVNRSDVVQVWDELCQKKGRGGGTLATNRKMIK